jgi:TrmH family RNA methyltransferase
MGGLWDLRIAATDDLAAALRQLRDRGLALYGADLDGGPAHAWSPRHEAVLVLGSEAHGLSADVTTLLDARVRIAAPPSADAIRGVESLNVSVAAGVLLHRWLGERRG